MSGSHALPPRWPPQYSCVVIESSFDPGERLQAPGSLWFSIFCFEIILAISVTVYHVAILSFLVMGLPIADCSGFSSRRNRRVIRGCCYFASVVVIRKLEIHISILFPEITGSRFVRPNTRSPRVRSL